MWLYICASLVPVFLSAAYPISLCWLLRTHTKFQVDISLLLMSNKSCLNYCVPDVDLPETLK